MDYDPTLEDLFDDEPETARRMPARGARSARLDDDLDALERSDTHGDDGPSAALQGILDDPETPDDEVAYGEATEEDMAESEAVDLSQFAGRGPDFERDPFEAFVRQSKKYGNMTFEKIEECVTLLQSSRDDDRAEAEDRLVKHSIRWIVRGLQKCAGHQVMSRAGDARDNALSVGLEGFLAGIRKYDPDKALRRGAKGHRKSILHYTEYWIKKYYEADRARRMGLNLDAAVDRNQILKAQRAIEDDPDQSPSLLALQKHLHHRAARRLARKTLGRDAAPAEIAQLEGHYIEEVRLARERAWQELAARELRDETDAEPEPAAIAARVEQYERTDRAVDYDVPRELRRAGAYTLDRLTSLPQHSTAPESMEAPALGGRDDGPTVGEYLESRTDGPDEIVARNELSLVVSRRLRRAADPKLRRMILERHGLYAEHGEGRHHVSNPHELMLLMGKGSRETILAAESQVERALRGESLVDPDTLIPHGFDFNVRGVRALHKQLAASLARQQQSLAGDKLLGEPLGQRCLVASECVELEDRLTEIRQHIRQAVNFKEFLARQGVTGAEQGRIACPTETAEAGAVVEGAEQVRSGGAAGTAETERAEPRGPRGRTALVDEEGFRCLACGVAGDLFDWLRASGLTVEEADAVAVRVLSGFRPTVEAPEKKVAVILDPTRRRSLQRL